MPVDTGSPVIVVSTASFRQLASIQLATVNHCASSTIPAFLGELTVAGQVCTAASCDGQTIAGALVVVGTPGMALCGTDIIKAFSQCGLAMLKPNIVSLTQERPDQADKALQTVLADFADAFASALQKYTGPPMNFQLKEHATRHFCKVHFLPYALVDKVSEALYRMVADCVLSPVVTTECATPVVPVVKPDRSIRRDLRLTVKTATVTEQNRYYAQKTFSQC